MVIYRFILFSRERGRERKIEKERGEREGGKWEF